MPPERAIGGGLLTGWAYPSLPAGATLRSEVLIVPLRGFSAVAELNSMFAADSTVDSSVRPLGIHFSLMPLYELPDVSVITRTYDSSGVEMVPCDPLLLDVVPRWRITSGTIACGETERPVAWYAHELYSAGARVDVFAIPAAEQVGPCPVKRPPEAAAVDRESVPLPGGMIPAAGRDGDRAFVLWECTGVPAREESGTLSMVLPEGESRTLFLGARALRAIDSLRFALAARSEGGSGPEPDPLPPAAVYLWGVLEEAGGPAQLQPLAEGALNDGEAAWFAITADARRLAPGRYAARLVVSADEDTREVPLDLTVIPAVGTDRTSFGLWYLGTNEARATSVAELTKLRDYGVTGLAMAGDRTVFEALQKDALAGNPLMGFDHIAFTRADGTLPPAQRAAGAALLAEPCPFWLVRAQAAAPAVTAASVAAGYQAAFLCERLDGVPDALLEARAEGGRAAWLVRDGVAGPDYIRRLVMLGRVRPADTIWSYLDLRGVDWRRAIGSVRTAAWAAAWQGLTGLAVRLDRPCEEADRQLALWHVVRDAHRDAALWRQASRTAVRVQAAAPDNPAVALAAQRLGGLVGTAANAALPLAIRHHSFGRTSWGITGSGNGSLPDIRQFETVRRDVLDVLQPLQAAGPVSRSRRLHWREIPLREGDPPNWAIFAPFGETVLRTAMELQRELEAAAGRLVPVIHTWPAEGPSTPDVIWAVCDEAALEELPEPVRAAVARSGGPALLAVDLAGGKMVAVMRPNLDVGALVATLRSDIEVYPTADEMR
jgi:hypothetical protein